MVSKDDETKKGEGDPVKLVTDKYMVIFFSSIGLSILSFAIGIHYISYVLKGKSGEGLAFPDQYWFFRYSHFVTFFLSGLRVIYSFSRLQKS